jgi:molybdopterin converting factor small subunit
VRLGAGLATAAGTRRLSVALPQGATVDTLLDRLTELEPDIAAGLGSALPVLRGTHAGRDQELSEGDEVALLIPVAGGCAGRPQPERRQSWP